MLRKQALIAVGAGGLIIMLVLGMVMSASLNVDSVAMGYVAAQQQQYCDTSTDSGSNGSSDDGGGSSDDGKDEASDAVPTNTIESFTKKYGKMAFDTGKKYGIPYEAILAQAALESGWGQSAPGHNYFGIKKWKSGPSTHTGTTEEVDGQLVGTSADWQAYDSDAAGFDGYGDFIVSNSNYRTALQYPNDPHQYLVEIKNAGYATNSDYVDQTWGLAQQFAKYIAQKKLFPPSSKVKPDRAKPSLNGGDTVTVKEVATLTDTDADNTGTSSSDECCPEDQTDTASSDSTVGTAPATNGDFSWMCSAMKVCKAGDMGTYDYWHFKQAGYQCVWYAWTRLAMIHGIDGWTTGSKDKWKPPIETNAWNVPASLEHRPGWTVDDTPHVGDGVAGPDPSPTGHILVVEEMKKDGDGWRIRLSEGNRTGGGDWCSPQGDGCWQSYSGTRWVTTAQARAKSYRFFRYKTWKGMTNTGSSTSSASTTTAAAKTVSTPISGSPSTVGWDTTKAESQFGGRQGPGNLCSSYAYGQCTWWACMRESMIGNKVGPYWGNGEAWVRSAVANGWKQGVVAPGGVTSFTPGSIDTYADGSSGGYAHHATAGHVAVIESVDTKAKTFTTTEKGGSTTVYTHTYSYAPLPANMSVAAPPNVKGGAQAVGGSLAGASTQDIGDTDADKTRSCVAQAGDKTSDNAGQASSVSPADGKHADPDKAKAIAKAMIGKYFPTDTDKEYDCVVWLWTKESDWQWNATNPSSGAYGIPQSLPGSKMADAGADWRDNATTQIKWGFSYIKETYDTPCNAKSTWLSRGPNHWY